MVFCTYYNWTLLYGIMVIKDSKILKKCVIICQLATEFFNYDGKFENFSMFTWQNLSLETCKRNMDDLGFS